MIYQRPKDMKKWEIFRSTNNFKCFIQTYLKYFGCILARFVTNNLLRVFCGQIPWPKVWALLPRVSVQGVKSLGGHFAGLCRGFDFYEVKKMVIIFQKEKGNTFTLLIIFIVKSLQKEKKSTNVLLWPPICRNKRAITQSYISQVL